MCLPRFGLQLYRFDVILSTEETVDSGVLFLAVENTQFGKKGEESAPR